MRARKCGLTKEQEELWLSGLRMLARPTARVPLASLTKEDHGRPADVDGGLWRTEGRHVR